jgi:thiol-disulfide isomerase/thioredoxin
MCYYLCHMDKQTLGLAIGAVVLTITGIGVFVYAQSGPGKLDSFAACLGEKGATFYGAFWCPHCQAQKALFGKSASKLPYVECSLPNGKTQTQICIDKGVNSYPTWEFADSSRVTGEQSLETLAQKTGCALPTAS